MNKNKIYQKNLCINGEKAIVIKAIEEMSELIKELSHSLLAFESKIDDKSDSNNIKSEIIDVKILIEQLENIFILNNAESEIIKKYKLDRLKCRLEKFT